jgi:hypothetical protein
MSPILLVCQLGEMTTLQVLLDEQEDPSAPGKNGLLPLHFAFMFENCSCDLEELIHFLLPRERRLWSRALEGVASADYSVGCLYPILKEDSPLSFAVFAGCKKISCLLLKADASPAGNLTQNSLISPRCAIYIATSLHLADLFLLLWEYASTIPTWAGC